jgi:hypothetical protein
MSPARPKASPAASAEWIAALVFLSAACSGSSAPEAASSTRPKVTPASVPAHAAPPSVAFVAPKTWKSWREGVQPVAPPDLTKETWRVFANRELPIQRETPLWQPLAADERVDLQMPVGSTYRCVVDPVEVTPQVNDWGTELLGWDLVRKLLCSGDGWQTWSEYPHRLQLSIDGTRNVAYASEAALRERTVSGEVYQTTVLLRSDKEERNASTGPARIIARNDSPD